MIADYKSDKGEAFFRFCINSSIDMKKVFITIALVCYLANTALSQDSGSHGRWGVPGRPPPPRCPPGCVASGGNPSPVWPPQQGCPPGWPGSGGNPQKGSPPGWGGSGGTPQQGGPPGWGGSGGYPQQGGPPGWGGSGGPPQQGGPSVWGGSGGPPNQGGPSKEWGGTGGPSTQEDPQDSWGGPGIHPRGPHGGPGGHRGPPGPPPNIYDMFPACASLAEAMRTKHFEMMGSGQIGPGNCPERDHKVCIQRDMETMRCEITEEAPQKCMDEVMAFMRGDICNGGGGETDGEKTLDPAVDEDSL
ncbi:hypothetical protein AVEN_118673-1 [Araneus ventricosus]|uniref:Uncharacterized protein n=1 Tax=Araneus ventricosus TaxID=182803 RepID=A0A4Y2AZ38_ARAVE|nr:hypothetical protein AVEN_118673-1 [Araneus ventricosus]